MKLTKDQLLGVIRHALTFIGGILITKGLVDESLFNLNGSCLVNHQQKKIIINLTF
jgi:hypothetical protein